MGYYVAMAVTFSCLDRKIPLAPVSMGVGAACAITLLAVGILATRGSITSLNIIGGVTLGCGLLGTASLLTTLFTGGAKKFSQKQVVVLTVLLSATVIAVVLVGVATLKGGYGVELTRPLSVSAGIGTAVLGSFLTLFSGSSCMAGRIGCRR